MPSPRPASIAAILLGVIVAIGAGVIAAHLLNRPQTSPAVSGNAKSAPALSLEYVPIAIGAPVSDFGRPLVTNLQIIDLDRDGLLDVLYCESQKNTVRWIRQSSRGVFVEQVIGEDISAPAHVSTADVNGSGRLDVLVASMGQIMPSNDRIGAVVILENIDDRQFRKHTVVDHTARVTDVRAANLSGRTDKKLDLVVGQFGYDQGQTCWMENKGDWNFETHVVNSQSGCVHTPVADFDGDGALDFAALLSQEWEEVHVFHNLGNGKFKDDIVWGSTNEDYGSSGLAVADVNRDGRPDLIYTNGDGFDYSVRGPRPWHALQWLENTGGGKFSFHRVGEMPGAYGPCAADLNGDGHIDLLSVSCFADWSDPAAVSMMAWINDGRQNFTPVVLAHTPTHLVAAAVGDLDGNGVPVIVTGGFHAFPPYVNMGNITLWRKK